MITPRRHLWPVLFVFVIGAAKIASADPVTELASFSTFKAVNIEKLAAGPAMVAWLESHAPAGYPHREGITAKKICEMAVQGDQVALQAVEHEALYLGLGLSNLINLFTPDAIVLSGSVMKSAPLFLDRIHEVIRRGCRFVPAEKTQLTLASLGDDTNLIGAARVWHYRFGR